MAGLGGPLLAVDWAPARRRIIDVLTGPAPAEQESEALVVPVFPGRSWGPGADWVAEAIELDLAAHLRDQRFKGRRGQVASVPGPAGFPHERIVFVGLGDRLDAEGLRRTAARASRAVTRHEHVATTLHLADIENGSAVECVTLGFLLGQYRFDKYRSKQKRRRTERLTLCDAVGADAAIVRGKAIADAVILSRDLVNEPAVGKPPAKLAERAQAMARASGLEVRVYDEKQVAEEGFGGLQAVAAGSANPPRMIELSHRHEDATKTVAFVGKGVVFDSGGLSIKSASSMEKMKVDMAGAAAVFGALQAVAALDLPVNIIGIAPLTENMPGAAAQRPGDVFRARNGKTVEVLNTDAEGRLILADALSLAAEQGPDLIVDVATLTGTVVNALGSKIAGVFATTDKVADVVLSASRRAGERMWRLPLEGAYRGDLDSDIADIKNIGKKRASPISAALFLKEFVGDTPWAHIDMAGPARTSSSRHYLSKGATGYGVRTLVEIAEHYAE